MRMLCLAAVLGCLCSTGYAFAGQNTPPVFDMKREWIIPEDEPVGRRVTTVRTRDDEGDPIEYGIEPAVFLDGSEYFRIDPSNGDVFLSRSLQGMAGSDNYLFITANDGHQTAKIEVYIRVVKPTGGATTGGAPYSPRVAFGPPLSAFHSPFHPALSRRPRPPPMPQETPPPAATTPATPPVLNSSVSTREERPENGDQPDWTSVAFPLVATVAFAPVGLVLLWLVHRRCKMKEKEAAEKKLSGRSTVSSALSVESGSVGVVPHLLRARIANSNRYEEQEGDAMVVPGDEKWEFPRHQLRFLCLLDEGCFGQVWKCEAINATGEDDGSAQLVAVKTLKEKASDRERSDLVKELAVMKTLDPHPNVISLLGCCTEKDPVFLILEFAVHGKLQSYLRQRRAKRTSPPEEGPEGENLTSRDLTLFAYQVAKGMEYLSSKGIVHRDLAARNVLVSEGKTCKVADFGFARDLADTKAYESTRAEGRFPVRWMAPESLHDAVYTVKTDVWSFGVLTWEIVTLGSTPYPGMSAPEVVRKVRSGYRLEKPEHCGRELYNVMFYCWEAEPSRRPTFSDLVAMLDRLLVSDNQYIELDRFPDHSYYNIITHLSGEKL